jgi:hypothetical protein
MAARDPYTELGVPPDAGDIEIRARYLELAREFSPEQHPAKFAAIRAAYDEIRSFNARVKRRLFLDPSADEFESILEDLACRTPRPRISLDTLFATVLPAR